MKKRILLIVSVIVTIVIAALAGFRIYHINQKYPNPKIVEYSEGKEIKGGNITLSVQKSQLLGFGQLKEIVPGCKNEVRNSQGKLLDDSQMKILMVDLKVVNTSNEERKTTLTSFMAQSLAWSNGWNLNLYKQLNNTDSTSINLLPHEEKVIKLGFYMYDFQFKNNDWKSVDEREFDLVTSVYPVKNIIKLKL